MIQDLFVETLQRRLPRADVRAGESAGVLAYLHSPHPKVPGTYVYDQGSEVMVFIGYTHAHFGDDVAEAEEPERTVAIAEEVATVLDHLVNDRLVMWGLLRGLIGGGYYQVGQARPAPSRWWFRGWFSRCLWSGPL